MMKKSRISLLVVVVMVLTLGVIQNAWGDANYIKSYIEGWYPGPYATSTSSGFSVDIVSTPREAIVTGDISGATESLRIIDDGNVTIRWKAQIQGDVDILVALGMSYSNQSVTSSGTFIVESGGEIKGGDEALLSLNGFNIRVESGGLVTSPKRAIGSEGKGGNIFIADGGRVESTGDINWQDHLIHLESDGHSITIDNEANALIKNGIVSLDDDTTYNGIFIPNLFDSSVKEPHAEIIFGDFTDPKDIPEGYYVRYAKGRVKTSPGKIFEIRGTLHNKGTIMVYGTMRNYGKHTVENEGTIEVASEGVAENYGNWKNVNAGQVINNGIFKSDQTVDEMGGGFSGNDVQPLNPGGGGGGCTTGLTFGLLPLILGGLVLSKKKNDQ
ncbi:MAG: hypothetical protein LBS55_04390 [Prevotellaceae bacterium]|jgi:hypothetical protein|nr:hypothetical protein [Prevotellaceae bacterium]